MIEIETVRVDNESRVTTGMQILNGGPADLLALAYWIGDKGMTWNWDGITLDGTRVRLTDWVVANEAYYSVRGSRDRRRYEVYSHGEITPLDQEHRPNAHADRLNRRESGVRAE